jgi:hypothetical protein
MESVIQISEHVRLVPDARIIRQGDYNDTPTTYNQTLNIARSIINAEMRIAS